MNLRKVVRLLHSIIAIQLFRINNWNDKKKYKEVQICTT